MYESNSYFFWSCSFTDCSLNFSFTHVQDNIDSRSEFEDDTKSASAFSVVSNFDTLDANTLGDISPDAL